MPFQRFPSLQELSLQVDGSVFLGGRHRTGVPCAEASLDKRVLEQILDVPARGDLPSQGVARSRTQVVTRINQRLSVRDERRSVGNRRRRSLEDGGNGGAGFLATQAGRPGASSSGYSVTRWAYMKRLVAKKRYCYD